jgi:hypothetical protein
MIMFGDFTPDQNVISKTSSLASRQRMSLAFLPIASPNHHDWSRRRHCSHSCFFAGTHDYFLINANLKKSSHCRRDV